MTAPTLLERLERVDDRGEVLRLARAWPSGADRLALEYERSDGSTSAAQWFADSRRADRVAAATPGASVPAPGVVLQPAGADRRLLDLATLAGEPGAELLVHRPERRGVVRRPNGTYAKIVRPHRVDALVTAHRVARTTGVVPTAELIGVDRTAGRLEWAAAHGRSLHDLLGDPDVGLGCLATAGSAIGRAVRRLHDAEVPAGVGRHTLDDEFEVAERWIRAARLHASEPVGASQRLERARRALGRSDAEPVLVHRDLHDKQLLVDGTAIVMLDLDTLALGDAAIDLANLLVHLELRVLQGVAPARALMVADTFLEAYRPDQATLVRVDAYGDATRARLAGVYTFRPRGRRATTIALSRHHDVPGWRR